MNCDEKECEWKPSVREEQGSGRKMTEDTGSTSDRAVWRWIWLTFGSTAALLALLGGLVVYVDPFFHFHGPLPRFSYPLDSERYQNDGLSRHLEYDAIVTGTSMTENFRTSQVDRLFGVSSIKIPFGGANYKEVNQAVCRAVSYNPQVNYVLRSLDGDFLLEQKDARNESAPDPEYLYDGNPFNDVNYIWNKEVIFGNVKRVLAHTRAGGRTTTFDEYMHWAPEREWGREAVLQTFSQPETRPEQAGFTEEDERMVRENLEQNVIAAARANPRIQFYLFVPPYSIAYWDSELAAKGNLTRYLEALRLEAELLTEYENIHLFAFDDQFDMICNLDNYMDVIHYSEEVGSQIIQWMAQGQHRLTQDNMDTYFSVVEDFYMNYDYDSIYSGTRH